MTKINGNPQHYVYVKAEQDYSSRPLADRIADEALKIFHNIVYFVSLVPDFLSYFFCRSSSYCTPSGEENQWSEKNSGLVVFVTGLNGHPVWSGPYLSHIEKQHLDLEVRIPSVPHQGDCTLQEAAEPIVAMVRDYIRKNPGKRVWLCGISNGGRIAGYCETRLRDEDAAIRVTGIAGVFFGSRRMEDLAKKKIAPLLYTSSIIEEFEVGSTVACDLVEAMRSPMPQGKEKNRSYEFYATPNDWHIPNFSSCLPILGKGERFHLVPGHSHLSIAGAVHEKELERAYAWMSASQK